MERAIVCKGDKTTHGGEVIEGIEWAICEGRQIAKIGCMTYCPKCGGNFPIIEGADAHTFAGEGTALHNMLTACGARLIASQDFMMVDDGSTGEEDEGGVIAEWHDAAARQDTSGAFCAADAETGAALPGLHYRIELSDGRIVSGVTDANGKTAPLNAQDRATAKLFWQVGVQGDA